MSTIKITDLTAQTTGNLVTANDVLPIVDIANGQTKKITVDTLTSALGANVTFNTGSAGIVHTVTSPAAADAYTYTAHGKKIEVRNKIIAAVVHNSSSLDYTVTNNSVDAQSCIVGMFLAGSHTTILSSSLVPHSSAANSFKFRIHASDVPLADGSAFTASFVVL